MGIEAQTLTAEEVTKLTDVGRQLRENPNLDSEKLEALLGYVNGIRARIEQTNTI